MTETKEKIWSVYMHVFPDNKKYIGIAKGDPKKRWGLNGNNYRGQYVYTKGISQYNWNHIQHIIIKSNLSEDEAYDLEEKLIKENKTLFAKYGYNLCYGKGNKRHTRSVREVRIVDLNMCFTSAKAAGEYLGFIYYSGITEACKHGNIHKGHQFEYVANGKETDICMW